jgi:putative endonuclease
MANAKSQTGQTGEQVAADFLKNKGYAVLEMNYKNDSGRRLGEIDIIAQDKSNGELVFVEVKTREYNKYKDTLPEENITYDKLRKLDKIANSYLYKNNLKGRDYRFDAVSVWLDFATRMAKIKHIPHMHL